MSAIDAQGRCTHWHGPDDVLWLKLACCDNWWPCRECHDETVDHTAAVWPAGATAFALRCGRCDHAFDIPSYIAEGTSCPSCGGAFNPGCRDHRDLYFTP